MLKAKRLGAVTDFCTGRNIGNFVFYFAHCFLVDDVLIDTSTVYVQKELVAALSDKRVSTIINTHHHEDHSGNNSIIQKKFGSEIYAHPLALPYLQNPYQNKLRFYERVAWNYAMPSTAQPLGEKLETDAHTFKVIHTPGHSIDHICLYEPELMVLFTGDLFCGEKVVYLRNDEDFTQILSSLRKVVKLDVRTIYCAVSGRVENSGVISLLERKIRFMERLQENVLELKEKGMSPKEIRKKLLGNEGYLCFISNGHFSKQNLINSILSS